MTQDQQQMIDAPVLKLENLHYHIEGNQIVSELSLSLNAGEILCLLGASGCGKTAVLKLVAGLLKPNRGNIVIAGQCVEGKQFVPTQQRNIGFVFQDYALFPHLTVAENISFGLNQQPKKQQAERVKECLRLVDLQNYHERYPHELSGGQQQRVAVARALAPKPKILLMDEPFSNIDCHLKSSIMEELRMIFKAQGVTVIFVTHSQQEAKTFADKVAEMESGTIKRALTVG
ncbi:hypothetical protein SOPP22_01860 [Shewanella sp. OPT22]|nr:hypothetical protein SOPP22_01860 [Shewanella sp. OPT22]